MSASDVVIARVGRVGCITLNRPKALNALTLDMVRAIAPALAAWRHDPDIDVVLLDGAGERGLCAGGDIKAMYAEPLGSSWTELWLREEYRLDAAIHRYPKPFLAIMDGMVMGGGIGLSGHASHRLVTERTRLAMPEVGIGFIPDVGGSWLLPRARHGIGLYMALTGLPIGGADAVHAGLADYYLAAASLPALKTALTSAPNLEREALSTLLARFTTPAPAARLAANAETIAALFIDHTPHEIRDRLASIDDDWAKEAAASLLKRSPLAVMVTWELMRRGRASLTLEDCLERELAVGAALLATGEFHEGVRAVVIDKDNAPRWRHASFEDVSVADVAACFVPRPGLEPVFPDNSDTRGAS